MSLLEILIENKNSLSLEVVSTEPSLGPIGWNGIGVRPKIPEPKDVTVPNKIYIIMNIKNEKLYNQLFKLNNPLIKLEGLILNKIQQDIKNEYIDEFKKIEIENKEIEKTNKETELEFRNLFSKIAKVSNLREYNRDRDDDEEEYDDYSSEFYYRYIGLTPKKLELKDTKHLYNYIEEYDYTSTRMTILLNLSDKLYQDLLGTGILNYLYSRCISRQMGF